MDTTRTQTTIRSFLWPGYIAFHDFGSSRKEYGGVYLGNGIKNSDLPFMI